MAAHQGRHGARKGGREACHQSAKEHAARRRRAAPPAIPLSCAAHCRHGRAEDALRRVNAALEQQARSIGQTLHDEAGQVLTAAYTALAAATDLVPPIARARLDEVKNHLEAIEEQFRRLAHELRPRILDDLGLIPALRFLIDGLRIRRGISATFAARVLSPLPVPVETAVYRLVQESITNIGKHANAQRVVVELEEHPRYLQCRIRDDGVGVKAPQQPGNGLGLIGIRERLHVLGGTLTMDSAPGRGTVLKATIPLEERDVRACSARRRSSNCA